MKYLNKIFIIALIAFFFSCNNNEELGMVGSAEMANDYYVGEEGEPIESGVKYANTNSDKDKRYNDSEESETSEEYNLERKLIKSGDISFATDSITETKQRIKQAVKKYKAYISSEVEDNYYDRISNDITIRVPFENFDKLLADIGKGVESFDSKNISISDVTSEYLDVEARIKTKKELENRYHELLNKANTVSEILEIEREIANLRSDIESYEGRLKYLKNQVSYSTLEVNFYKTKDVTTQNKFSDKFSDGFSNGWDNFIWFFVFLANVWPFILVILTIVFFVVRYERKRRKKFNTN